MGFFWFPATESDGSIIQNFKARILDVFLKANQKGPWSFHTGVCKNRGVSPKMYGEIVENLIKMDDLEVKPTIFRNTHIQIFHDDVPFLMSLG